MKLRHVLLACVLWSMGALASNWHFPLYLDNGQPFMERRKVVFENTLDVSLTGEPTLVDVKELGLVGCPLKEVRVVDSRGVELLFNVNPPERAWQEPLVAGDKLVIPVSVDAKGKGHVWVYSRNAAAWELPERMLDVARSERNSFEMGDSICPSGWKMLFVDGTHANYRSSTVSRSGKKSLQTTVSPNSTPSWVQFHRLVGVRPGLRYRVSMWVKGENIQQGHGAGMFLHIGPRGQEGIRPQNVWNLRGTFDWTKVELSGVIPPDANSLRVGTVLHTRGGTAWFDDFELDIEGLPSPKVSVGAVERLQVTGDMVGAPSWEMDGKAWPERVVFKLYNTDKSRKASHLVTLPINLITHGNYRQEDFCLYLDGKKLPVLSLNDILAFQAPDLEGRSVLTGCVYLSATRRNKEHRIRSKQASDILSDVASDGVGLVDKGQYERLLKSSVNMVVNASFERDGNWDGIPDVGDDGHVYTSIKEGSAPFRKRHAVLDIKDGKWHGYKQRISVVPGRTYLYAGWLNAEHAASVWAHAFDPADRGGYTNLSTSCAGTGWRMFAMNISTYHKNPIVELHLTSNMGHLEYDGILFAEVSAVTGARMEGWTDYVGGDGLRFQSIPPIVKVFQDTIPKDEKSVDVFMSRNEVETMQLAVRSSRKNIGEVRFEVSAPVNASGASLPAPELGVGGYVRVDSESRYYNFGQKAIHEMCVPSGVLPVMYPDPIFTGNALWMKPRQTATAHIRFRTPATAAPGDYRGVVTFKEDGRTIREVPYTVHVWRQVLPESSSSTAIFDNRFGAGREHKNYKEIDAARFLAKNRLSMDEIPAKPVFRLVDGKVTADFTEFDKVAHIWFDEWKIPLAYLPLFRECFGWAHFPKPFLGVRPYPGQSPYTGWDRGVFTDEYKRVCQDALKLMMTHLREKGWEDRFLLYISDEPFARQPEIVRQMQGLCDMMHEAWPTIKIYSSTWYFVPGFLGKLDVWGIGVQGQVTLEELEKIKAAGGKLLITTDGQQILDTPYCAVERLLPLYAWHYGALGYEFWGADWYMMNPFEWGIHKTHFHKESATMQPYRLRYPNGDGYVFYPEGLVKPGSTGILPSVRSEALRDGMEDVEVVKMLEKVSDKQDAATQALLDEARSYLGFPNAGGRMSLQLLPNPWAFSELRVKIGQRLSELTK